MHTINVEGWDILNNYSISSIDVNINNLDEKLIFNIFNFPNPFKNKTFFTFQMLYPEPINVNIDILSKTGVKIISFEETINTSLDYHVLPSDGWNGKNHYNETLNNGTYFYHLHITNNHGNILHSKIHNISIINDVTMLPAFGVKPSALQLEKVSDPRSRKNSLRTIIYYIKYKYFN